MNVSLIVNVKNDESTITFTTIILILVGVNVLLVFIVSLFIFVRYIRNRANVQPEEVTKRPTLQEQLAKLREKKAELINDTEDENDFLIQDFGTEYASDRDFKLQDLPNDTLIDLYKNRPELFESRRLQRLLNKLGVIDTPKINFNIKIEIDPSRIDEYVTGGWIVSRPRKNKEGKTVGRTVDIFETILSGDIWDIYDSYNDNNRWSDILDYYIDNNNEKLIWEKVKILSEKNDIEITNDMNLEDSIKLVDDNWDIRNVLTSSSSDAERDSFYNYLYKTKHK